MLRNTLMLLPLMALPGFAEDLHYDGSDPLLCTLMMFQQCDFDGCERAEPASLGIPKYVIADFKKKQLSSTEYSGVNLVTPIAGVKQVDNRLVLQGIDQESEDAEDANAWTMMIAEPTGMMTFTVALEEGAFVAFGACAPIE